MKLFLKKLYKTCLLYTSKLKLNYVPDYKTSGGSSGGGSGSSWNKKYRVTARSGLFIRKEPNGTKLTAKMCIRDSRYGYEFKSIYESRTERERNRGVSGCGYIH